MASRHLSRSIAMQSLYEWDFNGQQAGTLDGIIGKNMEEFGPGLDDKDFPRQLVTGVIEKLPQLDKIIEKAAPEWPINQIAMVDRNVLRLGLFELLFGDHAAVPPKVAINEAIELGKSFGGESSGKFVNGVLGTVYRELGEPGKEHPKRGEAVAPQQEDYVGAIVFRREGTAVQWAMIRDTFNHWTFVKGHRKPEESLEDGALRKVREEIGVGGRVVALLGKNSYPAKNEQREPVLRNVNYFLVETDEATLTAEKNAGIVEAQWFPMEAVLKTKHYDDTNHIIEAAMEKLTNGK
ncbi:MAG: transcription antitermination factor NusB [bacterium]|nr:transcription antitermination factor NusB [bacterium]